MRKKYKALLLLLLIILIVICKNILVFDSLSYKLNIEGNQIKIKEKINKNNYYIEIKTNKNVYPFRIYNKLNNKRKVVKDIYLYKDKNIECILPIINEKTYTDMMCYKDDILYDYNYIVKENYSLDKFVNSIDLYNLSDFENKQIDTKKLGTVKYNIYDNFKNTVAITTYKGLIINTEEMELFKKEIYDNKLSLFLDHYYIIADYEKKYSFNYFYIIDLNTKKISKLESKNDISYDSYIQGIVEDKIYLYDKDNEVQYEIDINKRNINIISNGKYIKYYENQKWGKMNKIKANKEIYFEYETLDNKFPSYDYVKETKNYYYLFKKDGIYYKLYRVDKDNTSVYKYIINIPTTKIYFKNNYLYYVYKNKLFYYSDRTGLKIILENSELEFNDTIKYYIY